MSKKIIEIPRFADLHFHPRNGEMLRKVLPHTALYCSYATVMPNLVPAIRTASEVKWYRKELMEGLNGGLFGKESDFTPLMTIAIQDSTTPEMVYAAKEAGAVAGKVYPLGATTNSDNGLRDFNAAYPIFEAMQECGMLLLLHGEQLGDRILVTDREKEFMVTFIEIVTSFPKLKIVLEHITTKDSVDMISRMRKGVAATITGHHLYLTLNDVIGSGICTHNYCMPVAKGFDDRDALIAAATSGNPKFFLGSDSAPHLKGDKESACGCAGVYTAPVLPAILAQVFEENGALDKLANFTSGFGTRFYGLKQSKETIKIIKEDWKVPALYDGVVPFKAEEILPWKLVE